jgi:hypothetical protein
MLEVITNNLSVAHHCRLSDEERAALKDLSVFLQRVEKTKWAVMLAVLTAITLAAFGALWLGIKQIIKGQ